MATTFDTHFAAAGFSILLDQFGESITYLPHHGVEREVTAIVNREPPAVLDAAGNAVFPRLTVRVYNSTTTGISSAEVDIGKDEMLLPLKIGDTDNTRFSLLTMVSQDAGVTHLAVR